MKSTKSVFYSFAAGRQPLLKNSDTVRIPPDPYVISDITTPKMLLCTLLGVAGPETRNFVSVFNWQI